MLKQRPSSTFQVDVGSMRRPTEMIFQVGSCESRKCSLEFTPSKMMVKIKEKGLHDKSD